MTFIEVLDKIISELEAKSNNTDKKEAISSDINTLKKCRSALENEEEFISVDFTEVFNILEREGIDISNIVKYIDEVKDVINMKKSLNLEGNFYSPEQVSALEDLRNRIIELGVNLELRLSEIEEDKKSLDDLEKLKELRSILLGVGRKKYYTDINALLDNIDYESLSDEEFESMTNLFFNTRNFRLNQGLNQEELEDVISLFKEYLSPREFEKYEPRKEKGLFLKLLKDYAPEITTKIDLFEARQILEFLKSVGILEKFERKALLKIALYGKYDYLEEYYYKISGEEKFNTGAYFTDTLSCLWINNSKTKRTPFGKSKTGSSKKTGKSLSGDIPSLNDEQFEKSIEILRANSHLFEDEDEISTIDSHIYAKIANGEQKGLIGKLLRIILETPWACYKNNSLLGMFNLGQVYRLPISVLGYGDIEKKIHLAIELGLLNPPMDDLYRQFDKDSELNSKFMALKSQNGIFNNTIRNYFARNMSVLAVTDINTYGFLLDRLLKMGPAEFYGDYFFSKSISGMRDKASIDEDMSSSIPKKVRINEDTLKEEEYLDKDEFIKENFVSESDFVSQVPYAEWYFEEIDSFEEEDKNDLSSDKPYYDESVFNDELIEYLESNFRVVDTLTQNDAEIKMKNPYVYNINGRLYSRFRVLRYASILLRSHAQLDDDMLLSALCHNTFVKQEELDNLKSLLSERTMKI